MSATAPPPPPPPLPPNSNQPMHYFDLPLNLKWGSKNKSSGNPSCRGRHQKPPNLSKKKPPSSNLVAPTSPQLPSKSSNHTGLEEKLANQASSSSLEDGSLHLNIPKSNIPFHKPSALPDVDNSDFDSSFLDFIMSLYDPPNVAKVGVNSESYMLHKKECLISGMHIEIENKEQKHDEDVNEKEEHVDNEEKGKEVQFEIENTEENKDGLGKEGIKFYFIRSKMSGQELINEQIQVQIPMEEKEATVDEKDEHKMDAHLGESNETAVKCWNLRPRKTYQKPQNVNAEASVSSKVGGELAQKNKDKQLKDGSEKEQKEKQKNTMCKKNGKGGRIDAGWDGNETILPKLPKFSLQLTDEEIAEDLLAMTGARPSRKPKRRSKNAQRGIYRLTPGLYLDSITSSSYEVHKDTGQRI